MLSPDSSTPNAAKKVLECIENDKNFYDYYDLLTKYGNSLFKENYYFRAMKSSDIAKTPEKSPFPEKVKECDNGKFGYLELINKFYCISKNILFLWENENPDQSLLEIEEIEYKNKDGEILAVSCFVPDHNLISKNVPFMVAVATTFYIKLYPFVGEELTTDVFYSVQTDFVPFSLSPGPNHILFVGAHDGNIHTLSFANSSSIALKFIDINDAINQGVELQLKKHTNFFLVPEVPEILRFSESAVIQMIYNPTTKHLAALDDRNSIKFYSYIAGKFIQVGSYCGGNSPFVSICPISSSESKQMEFVAFNTKSQAFFFGHTKRILVYMPSISLQFLKDPPPDIPQAPLIYGAYSLNTYVFVYATGIMVITASPINADEVITPELIRFNGCVAIPLRHSLDFIPQNQLFKDPSIYCHVIQPPRFALINTDSTCFLDASDFYENLYRTLNESRGGISQSVSAIIGIQERKNANLSGALALAQNRPDFKPNVLRAFSLLKSEGASFTEALFIRASKFLGLIYSLVPFEENKLSKAIKDIPLNFNNQINDFILLIRELMEEEGDPTEKSNLTELIELLQIAQEVIILLRIISTQDKIAVEKAFSKLSLSKRSRLQSKIGKSNAEPIVVALREFIPHFIDSMRQTPELDLLSAQICRECPHITSYETAISIEAESLLNKASLMQKYERESVLRQACNSYCELIKNVPTDLNAPIRRFIELGGPVYAVEVALAWKNEVDPTNRALDWFDSYCNKRDTTGFNAFQKVFRCYTSAIGAADFDDGLQAILDTNDKLFIYTAFDHISPNISKLISLSSPFLEEYISDNQRKKLWQYYAKTDQTKACSELIHLAVDGIGFSMEDRIKWLTEALHIARKINNSKLKEESQTYLERAQYSVQLEPQPDRILSIAEVGKLALERKQYLIAIEAFSFLNDQSSVVNCWKSLISRTPAEIPRALHTIKHDSIAADPRLLVPLLEDTRILYEKPDDYALNLLIEAGINLSKVADAYAFFIDRAPPEMRKTLIVPATKLLELGYGNKDKLQKLMEKAK